MDYKRTLEDFGKARKTAVWMANFHHKTYYVIVAASNPKQYTVTASLDNVALAEGTGAYEVKPE